MSAKYDPNFQELFSTYVRVTNDEEGDGKEELKKLRLHFAQFSKKISQLIAKSWLPEEKDKDGPEIRKALLSGESEEIKKVFKKHGVDFDKFVSPQTIYCNVDWNTFFGSLKEVATGNQMLICDLPYPPRPMEVTNDQLEKWVNDDRAEHIYPEYPYIPLSSGC